MIFLNLRIGIAVSEGNNQIAEMMAAGEINLVLNTPLGRHAYDDSRMMRAATIRHAIPLLTTLSAAQAAVNGIRALREKESRVRSLQAQND